MRRVAVPLPGASYEILIGRGLLREAGTLLAPWRGRSPVVVVSDSNTRDLYASSLCESLGGDRKDARVHQVSVPPGESSKSIEALERLYRGFAAAELDRGSLVIALGGGVV